MTHPPTAPVHQEDNGVVKISEYESPAMPVTHPGSALWSSKRLRVFGMLCCCLALHSAIRASFNLALVAMVNDTSSSVDVNISSSNRCPGAEILNKSADTSGEFSWTVSQQSQLLSSFFYGYVVLQIPTGYLSERFGGKRILVLCSLLAGAGTLLVPVMARWSFDALLVVRIATGIVSGPVYVAIYSIAPKWGPKDEITVLIGIISCGFASGVIITFATSGLLIGSGFLGGWPSVFYIYGGVLVLWAVVWMFWGADSPAKDSNISSCEREYIEKRTDGLDVRKYETPPWDKILTSPAVLSLWLVIATEYYGFYILLSGIVFFMKQMLGYDIQANGLLVALQYLPGLLSICMASNIVDLCRKKNILSNKAARVTASFTGDLGMATVLLAIALFFECNRIAVTSLLVVGQFLQGIIQAGFVVSPMDIAPMYAGTIMSVGNFMGNVMGIVAPLTIGWIVGESPTREGWQIVFISTAAIMTFGTVTCAIFIKGEQLEWAKTDKFQVGLPNGHVASKDDLDFNSNLENQPLIKGECDIESPRLYHSINS